MALVLYAATARADLVRILSDPTRSQLADRIREVIAILKADAGDVRVRRTRFQNPPAWAVVVHGNGDEVLILWQQVEDRDDTVAVIYVGFASWL
jgi:hypothetical protein